MIRLKALTDISDRPEYASAFARLYRKQQKEKNPFFAILYQDNSQKTDIAHYLDSYPLTLNSQLILPDASIELKKRPPHQTFENGGSGDASPSVPASAQRQHVEEQPLPSPWRQFSQPTGRI